MNYIYCYDCIMIGSHGQFEEIDRESIERQSTGSEALKA